MRSHVPTRTNKVPQTRYEYDAIELHESNASSDEDHSHRTPARSQNAVVLFWKRHISVTVAIHCSRDHLANERTFLGYIRTAQAFAVLGVIISQLTRIQHSPTPDPVFGFFVLSLPLALICHLMAIVTVTIGCVRFFHWQTEMIRSNAITGGWEVMTVFLLSFSILFSIFVLVISIIVERDR